MPPFMLVIAFTISFGPASAVNGVRSSPVVLTQTQCDAAVEEAAIPPELKLLAKRGSITRMEHYCLPVPMPKVASQ